VVTTRLGGSAPIAGLGVIGPVRMRYDRVIPLVRRVSERVGEVLV
jgi:transcriptional regulator of heat shock response